MEGSGHEVIVVIAQILTWKKRVSRIEVLPDGGENMATARLMCGSRDFGESFYYDGQSRLRKHRVNHQTLLGIWSFRVEVWNGDFLNRRQKHYILHYIFCYLLLLILLFYILNIYSKSPPSFSTFTGLEKWISWYKRNWDEINISKECRFELPFWVVKRIRHKRRIGRTERSLQTSHESHERDIDLFLERHIKLGDSEGRMKNSM